MAGVQPITWMDGPQIYPDTQNSCAQEPLLISKHPKTPTNARSSRATMVQKLDLVLKLSVQGPI